MAADDHSNDSNGADVGNVAICVQKLNHTIGELARCYGAKAVVVALTEIMGCAACATDSVERGASIRTLVKRMGSGQ